jgi:hypothetical protein
MILECFHNKILMYDAPLPEYPMCDKNHISRAPGLTRVRTPLAALALCASSAVAAVEIEFDEHLINAGFHVDQPVLVASLEDDARHLVLAGRDDKHRQRLAIYALHDTTEPLLQFEPGPQHITYDVGRIGGNDAVFFVEPGRIMRLDIGSGKTREFIKMRSIYGQLRSGRLAPIDFVRDINGDDRDDFVVPDTAGYRVRLQRADGSLGKEVVLQDSSSMTVSDGVVSFASRPLVSGNMTADDLPDLAVWRGNTLQVYEQLPDDRFDGRPQIVTLTLGLQSEAEMLARQAGFGAVNQEGLVETTIWGVDDLNGDGLPDILTESLLNKGVFDKENDFRLHLGRRDGEQINFAETQDALLASTGLQYGLIATDINGDGRKDLLVRKVRMSFGRVIRALLSGNVSLQLLFYEMTDDDTFAEEANFETRTNVSFSVSSGQVDIPAIQLADFNADGLQDLMMQNESDQLSFQFGVRSEDLFAEDAVERTVPLPRNGELVSTEDLDEDGRDDLVIRYNESDETGYSKTIRLLITRQ